MHGGSESLVRPTSHNGLSSMTDRDKLHSLRCCLEVSTNSMLEPINIIKKNILTIKE